MDFDRRTVDIKRDGAHALALPLGPDPAPRELQHRLAQDLEVRRFGHQRREPRQGRLRGETKMPCVKLLGQRLSARDFDRQVAEFQVRVAVLNGFTALGTPITEAKA